MDSKGNDREPVRQFDLTNDPDPVLKIVHEVSALEGVDPLSLPPLAYSVDVDVLDAVVSDSGTSSRAGGALISFSYAGYDLTVEQSGSCSIFEPVNETTKLAGD